jgi:hypothetical protein
VAKLSKRLLPLLYPLAGVAAAFADHATGNAIPFFIGIAAVWALTFVLRHWVVAALFFYACGAAATAFPLIYG